MPKYSKRVLLANTFGTFGYISCLLLWTWVAILYLPVIFSNEQIKGLLLPSSTKEIALPSLPEALWPAVVIFAVVLTVVIMAVTIIVLLRAPVTIARTGKAMTTKTAGSLAPLVVRGRPLPAKERRRLTASLIKLIKLLLVLAPAASGLLSAAVPLALPFEMVMLVSAVLAIMSILWFSAQYVSAAMLHVAPEKLV